MWRSVETTAPCSGLGSTWRRLATDRAGSVAIIFGLALPVILTLVALSFDYAVMITTRDELQRAADAGAVAGAKELSLSDSRRENTSAAVRSVVDRFINTATAGGRAVGATIEARIAEDPLRVEVTLSRQPALIMSSFLTAAAPILSVTSSARVIGKPNICILGLDPSAGGTISLDQNANVLGQNCAVFSNSTHTHSIKSKISSLLSASFICAAGGRDGGKGNFSPDPITDCPQFEDPLLARPEPLVGGCMQTKMTVSGIMATLQPGVYCGGLAITGGADVRLQPGVYVIKDGPLAIGSGARIAGVGVGFFLTGSGAVLDIAGQTTISLEAGSTGEMAGLLFFEGRSQPESGKHTLLSDNAQVMVGTVYLPRGRLAVGGTSRIGGESAYTAIVARTIELTEGPRIVLNTNYEATSVPVPDGIKGAGQPVALIK